MTAASTPHDTVAETQCLPSGQTEPRRSGVRQQIRKALPYTVVALLVAVYLFPFVRVLWGWADEGAIVDGAARVVRGELPGRDFLEPMGPGAFYWLACFYRVFGVSMWTARALLLATGVGMSLLTFRACRLIGSPAWFTAFCVTMLAVPFWSAATHHWDSDLFALAALVSLLSWQRSRSPYWLLASGTLIGMTGTIMQQKGVLLYLAAGGCVIFLGRSWRHVAVLSLGFAIPLLMMAGWYVAHGAFRDLIYAGVVWPATHYMRVNSVSYGWFTVEEIHRLNGLAQPVVGNFLPVLALLAMIPVGLVALPVLLALCGWTVEGAFDRCLMPCWICGAALWLAELQRPDQVHFHYGSLIWLILLCALISRMRHRRQIMALLIASLACVAVFNLVYAFSARNVVATRAGAFRGPVPDPALASLISRTRPNEYILVYPYFSLYYVLADLRNPIRESMLIFGQNDPAEFRAAVKAIDDKCVRYVFWDPNIKGDAFRHFFPNFRDPKPKDLIMEPYLEAHYHSLGPVGRYVVMERNAE